MRILNSKKQAVTFEVDTTASPKPVGYSISEAFLFKDLPQEVQEKIHENELPNMYYPWNNENINAIDSFLDGFSCHLSDYSYDEYAASYRYRCRDESYLDYLINLFDHDPIEVITNAFPKRYIKKKYAKKAIINGEVISSGYCVEYTCFDYLDEIVKKFNSEKRADFKAYMKDITLLSVIETCLDNAFESCKKDCENFYSFDYFKEQESELDRCYSWHGAYLGDIQDLTQAVDSNKDCSISENNTFQPL